MSSSAQANSANDHTEIHHDKTTPTSAMQYQTGSKPSAVSRLPADLLTREADYQAFMQQRVAPFWQQGVTSSIVGKDNIRLSSMSFTAPDHDNAILIVNGRLETYLKYQELAYDLFLQGYDVFLFDHRGQGLSGRLLPDPQKGYVQHFSDYVSDMKTVRDQLITQAEQARGKPYQHRYLLAHSMGGAISSLYLARYPHDFTAAALSAPMHGIVFPMPMWQVKTLTTVAKLFTRYDQGYAPSTGPYQATPFAGNDLTHSQARYQWFRELYAAHPQVQLGGPTLHWIGESVQGAEQAIVQAGAITTPLLLLQGGDDTVVDNQTHRAFCEVMQQANHPCANGSPITIQGAHHELLFEQDAMRKQALQYVLNFFNLYSAVH
ncbi:MAG: lysophospholipase L2 [Plesiomonas sp.]